MSKQRDPAFGKALALLNANGWSDPKIAKAFGLSPNTIAKYRGRLNIPVADTVYKPKFDRAEAMRMWERGASDGEIARRFGGTQSGATRWRQRAGLSRNFDPNPRPNPDVRSRITSMLRLGASRGQVCAAIDGASIRVVGAIRRKMSDPGVRRTGVSNRAIRARILKDKTVLPTIEKAIGKDIPPDIRHDAVSDLYLAVLSGRIAKEFIADQAPKFRSRSFEMNYGRYTDLSIDADRGGWTLGDYIEDEDAMAFADGVANDDY